MVYKYSLSLALHPLKTFWSLVFLGAYQVNVYGPVDKVVTVLVGSGQKGNEDGKTKICTFAVQPHGTYTVGKLIATDAATRNVKLITELSGTTQFLNHFFFLYLSTSQLKYK